MLNHIDLARATPAAVAIALAVATLLFGVWLLRREVRRWAAGNISVAFGLASLATLAWAQLKHDTASTYLQALTLGGLALSAIVFCVVSLITRGQDELAHTALVLLLAVTFYQLDHAAALFDSKSAYNLYSCHYVLLTATVLLAARGAQVFTRWARARRRAFECATPNRRAITAG